MPDNALPAVDQFGNLPPGVHDATLAEVERVFGRFQRSDRRMRLFQRLRQYVGEVSNTGWVAELPIDGSFVMTHVDEPEDVDMILVLAADWDFSGELRPFEYNLVSTRRVRKQFHFDIFAVGLGSAAYNDLVEYFLKVNPKWIRQFSWPTGLQKGIVRIVT